MQNEHKLAIDGGKKAVPDSVKNKGWPIITQNEIDAVVNTLKSGVIWGTDAPNVRELEKEWADYCGAKFCKATNGGTAAIHMGLVGVGVQAGDEVIVPAYTFHSTASAILHHNAIPRFVDIDFNTYTIDPKKIEAAITDKTKAIIGVDLFGLPAKWDAINKIAKKHNIHTVEDACQAHGAAINGKRTGTLGDISAFSLNGSKNLPGAEGGLLTSNNADFMEGYAKLEMSVQTIDGKRVYPKYSFGWNYRMNELAATLTLSELKSLDKFNDQRRTNCNLLSEHLRKLEGVVPPTEPEGFHHVYHMYKIALTDALVEKYKTPMKELRDNLLFALKAEGVSTQLWVQDVLPGMDIYKLQIGYGNGCPWTCPFGPKGKGREVTYNPNDYPESKRLIESTFNLDYFYPPNQKEYLDGVILAFEKIWENLDSILG